LHNKELCIYTKITFNFLLDPKTSLIPLVRYVDRYLWVVATKSGGLAIMTLKVLSGDNGCFHTQVGCSFFLIPSTMTQMLG
jgi:hypothetical protein